MADRRRILAEIGEFADVIDYATGVALAEEDGGGAFDDFHALDVLEVVGGVAENAVTHQTVDDESAHRERALRGRGIGRDTHGKPGVARGGRRIAEQIGEGPAVGVVEEFARDHLHIQGDLLDLHADARGGGGVRLKVAVVLVRANLERRECLHAFVGFQRCGGVGCRGFGGGRGSGGGRSGGGGLALELGQAFAQGGVFVLQTTHGVG